MVQLVCRSGGGTSVSDCLAGGVAGVAGDVVGVAGVADVSGGIPRLAGGVACIAGVVAGGIAVLNSLYKEPDWYALWYAGCRVQMCVCGGGGDSW